MPLLTHKITICGIPELPQHCSTGVSHVLSIIDTHEPRPSALDDFFEIDHELIRFDDVVAEYPGFEACTPAHIEKLLAFGEKVHANPEGHVLVHCHAGVSRSTAAAAILMTQHAPGQEEATFLRLLDLRKHGWPNTRMKAIRIRSGSSKPVSRAICWRETPVVSTLWRARVTSLTRHRPMVGGGQGFGQGDIHIDNRFAVFID